MVQPEIHKEFKDLKKQQQKTFSRLPVDVTLD